MTTPALSPRLRPRHGRFFAACVWSVLALFIAEEAMSYVRYRRRRGYGYYRSNRTSKPRKFHPDYFKSPLERANLPPITSSVPRVPAMSATAATAGVVAARRESARQRAVSNPKLAPLFEGQSSSRRNQAAGRIEKAISTRPAEAKRKSTQAAQIAASRRAWAGRVRTGVAGDLRNVFSDRWWGPRKSQIKKPWFYYLRDKPVAFWWQRADWAKMTDWLGGAWAAAYAYDYDHLIYNLDEIVYLEDEPVCSYEDYLEILRRQADADEPGSDKVDWLPLGTFALATDPDDVALNKFVQLVLGKDGVVSGTYFNLTTSNAQPIHGSADRRSQRVVFTIGFKEEILLETGLANLGQDEAPVWVHFTENATTQTWLLARLEAPK